MQAHESTAIRPATPTFPRLFASLACYVISCFPPGSRRTVTGKGPVVVIGVGRHRVGCDNGICSLRR